MPTDAYTLFKTLVVDSWQLINQRQRAKAHKYNEKIDKKKAVQKLISENLLHQIQ
jgi:hypothetical protein